MILVVIAWLYVTLMMAVAEATATNGSLLGALITFALYGLLPVSIIVYVFSTPVRKHMRKIREEQVMRQWQAQQQDTAESNLSQPPIKPDSGSQPPAST
ncbi:hypothetical protein G7047_09280 [Diaphorobacter sp. HDW4A]|uniref:hypothetical protein n=1 Tax=Diaphorobacter sp. HDW4A TaxID=2714924 RepID=UPI00140C460E|nr:hypothetical protein [Diaphorobacter sp. HDW4A]QIL83798.1 hypothetical protein G7047_09280 [Diaphorobacter sp. HDW4A]